MTDPALPTARKTHASRFQIQFVILVTAVAAAATLVALFLLGGGHKSTALPRTNSGPVLVSQAQLEQLAEATAFPVYWAGPREGYSYELTRAANNRTYIRYLPHGIKAGDPRPGFLVVGSYEEPRSFASLRHAAKSKGTVSLSIANGGIALFSSARPTSVYFSYPGARYQVEVYDPSADAARKLVLGGSITALR